MIYHVVFVSPNVRVWMACFREKDHAKAYAAKAPERRVMGAAQAAEELGMQLGAKPDKNDARHDGESKGETT